MSFQLPQSHPDRILASVQEGSNDIEPIILGSWRRSVKHYQLDPSRAASPRVLTGSYLRIRREPMEPLMRIARGGVETLYQQIHEAGYVVLLTDPEGVTVDFIGNPKVDRELRHAGLYLGSCWSESEEGTCAVGTAIAERKPLTVHRQEHFRSPNAGLTCSAAPLFNADGSLLGVLDASALYSPDDKRSQHLVLQLVKNTARAIENAHIMERYGHLCIVRLGSRREFVEVMTEGVLAVDHGGYIVAANGYAREALREVSGKLTGQLFDQVFETPLTAMIPRFGSSHFSVQMLRPCGARASFFAHVRAPRRTVASPAANIPRREEGQPADKVRGSARPVELVASDSRIVNSFHQSLRVVGKGIPIMLRGETGTGKEVFAQSIHAASSRAGKPFVAINCGAIPEALIESELFGYVSGTFTGAVKGGMKGKIANADGGTLFLDEIGDMPLHLQTRLLRVLAEGHVTPLGADRPITVDLQVISATHRELRRLVESGAFREDLYYRLSGLRVALPPLRERTDRRELFQTLLAREAARLGHPHVELAPAALDALEQFKWPGNIRQLVSVLRAAVALNDSGRIELDDIAYELGAGSSTQPAALAPQSSEATPVEAAELLSALRRNSWNVSRAAESMGICRATAYRRMRRYHIDSPNHRDHE
jgi:transcriptional regulator of acetoin/glycerol metabolism